MANKPIPLATDNVLVNSVADIRSPSTSDGDTARGDKSPSSPVGLKPKRLTKEERKTRLQKQRSSPLYWFLDNDRCLFIFPRNGKVQTFADSLTHHPYFETTILVLIGINCLCLALFDPKQEDDSSWNQPLEYVQLALLGCFTVEMVLKILAGTFLWGPRNRRGEAAYLTNPWSQLDFVVVVTGFLEFVPGMVGLSGLRALRGLRPLRSIDSMPGVRVLVVTLLNSLPLLCDVLSLLIWLFVMFGILGMQLWMGRLDRRCFYPPPTLEQLQLHYSPADHPQLTTAVLSSYEADLAVYMDSSLPYVDTIPALMASLGPDGLMESAVGRLCTRQSGEDKLGRQCVRGQVCLDIGEAPNDGYMSFDSFLYASLLIFQVLTLSGWEGVMFAMADTTEPAVSYVYWLLLVVLGAYFSIQLVVAVICSNFSSAQAESREAEEPVKPAEEENGGRPASPGLPQAPVFQEHWIVSKLRQYEWAEEHVVPYVIDVLDYEPPWRDACRRLIAHPVFDKGVLLLIILNTITMMIVYHNMPSLMEDVLDWANTIFTILFLAEMGLKWLGMGLLRYWTEPYNAMDGVVNLIGILDLAGGGANLSALRTFRLIRVLRSLRIVQNMEELKRLAFTIVRGIMSLGDFTVLLCLFTFVFIVVGMQMFGRVTDADVVESRRHFNDFGTALLTLFEMLTGNAWDDVMRSHMLATSDWAAVYFVAWMVAGNLVLLSLFLAILIENMDNMGDEEESSPKPAIIAILKSHPLFRYCTDHVLDKLSELVRMVVYEPGEVVVEQGTPMEAMLFLQEGPLTVFREKHKSGPGVNPDAAMEYTQALTEGATVGEDSLDQGDFEWEFSACVPVADPDALCLVGTLRTSDFLRILQRFPSCFENIPTFQDECVELMKTSANTLAMETQEMCVWLTDWDEAAADDPAVSNHIQHREKLKRFYSTPEEFEESRKHIYGQAPMGMTVVADETEVEKKVGKVRIGLGEGGDLLPAFSEPEVHSPESHEVVTNPSSIPESFPDDAVRTRFNGNTSPPGHVDEDGGSKPPSPPKRSTGRGPQAVADIAVVGKAMVEVEPGLLATPSDVVDLDDLPHAGVKSKDAKVVPLSFMDIPPKVVSPIQSAVQPQEDQTPPGTPFSHAPVDGNTSTGSRGSASSANGRKHAAPLEDNLPGMTTVGDADDAAGAESVVFSPKTAAAIQRSGQKSPHMQLSNEAGKLRAANKRGISSVRASHIGFRGANAALMNFAAVEPPEDEHDAASPDANQAEQGSRRSQVVRQSMARSSAMRQSMVRSSVVRGAATARASMAGTRKSVTLPARMSAITPATVGDGSVQRKSRAQRISTLSKLSKLGKQLDQFDLSHDGHMKTNSRKSRALAKVGNSPGRAPSPEKMVSPKGVFQGPSPNKGPSPRTVKDEQLIQKKLNQRKAKEHPSPRDRKFVDADILASPATTPRPDLDLEALPDDAAPRKKKRSLVADDLGLAEPEEEEEREDLYLQHRPMTCLVSAPGLRRRLSSIIEHKWFDNTMLTVIIFSSVLLAVEEPVLRDDSPVRDTLFALEYVVTVVFLLEFVLKVSVMGWYQHEGAYFRSSWNCLDGLIVAFSIPTLLFVDALGPLKAFRMLRVLRPLRAIKQFPAMVIVVNGLMQSLPSVYNVIIFGLFQCTVFGILGVQLFMGQFYYCNDGEVGGKAECVGMFEDAEGYGGSVFVQRQWLSPVRTFDSLPAALLALYAIQTGDDWTSTMYAGMDITGVDMQPEQNAAPWMSLYFIIYMGLGVMMWVNLLVSVVCDFYSMAAEAQMAETGTKLFETEDQARWRATLQFKMEKMNEAEYMEGLPDSGPRHWLVLLMSSRQMEWFIMGSIGTNTLVMLTEHATQSEAWGDVLAVVNLVFSIVFICEAVLKLLAYFPRNYFNDGWNRFDFAITLITLLDITLNLEAGASIFRVLRLARLLKMVQGAKGIRALLNTLICSLPAIYNVSSLMFLLLYVFTIIGMHTFGDIEPSTSMDDPINPSINFRTFGTSLMSMVAVFTGTNVNALMEAVYRSCDDPVACIALPEDPAEGASPLGGEEGVYRLAEGVYASGMYYAFTGNVSAPAGFIAPVGWEELPGCAAVDAAALEQAPECEYRHVAPAFFSLYYLLGSYIMLNIMVAVVLDNFVGTASVEDLLEQETVMDVIRRKFLLDSFVNKMREKVLMYRAILSQMKAPDPQKAMEEVAAILKMQRGKHKVNKRPGNAEGSDTSSDYQVEEVAPDKSGSGRATMTLKNKKTGGRMSIAVTGYKAASLNLNQRKSLLNSIVED